MFKYFNALVVIVILLITGCAKEIDFSLVPGPTTVPGTGSSNCQIANLKADLGILGSYDVKFSYDATGKLVKTTSGADISNFVYTTNAIVMTDQEGEQSKITLVNGRASESVVENFVNEIDIRRVYSYNAEGYLVMVKNYAQGGLNSTDELSYANGNLVQSKTTYTVGSSVETTTYEYTSAIAKNVYELFDPVAGHVDYLPGAYFGKQSKNILSKSSSTIIDANGKKSFEEVTNYIYVFNSVGNATSFTMNQTSRYFNPDGSSEDPDTYQAKFELGYTCK